jgi:hypothetical protein
MQGHSLPLSLNTDVVQWALGFKACAFSRHPFSRKLGDPDVAERWETASIPRNRMVIVWSFFRQTHLHGTRTHATELQWSERALGIYSRSNDGPESTTGMYSVAVFLRKARTRLPHCRWKIEDHSTGYPDSKTIEMWRFLVTLRHSVLIFLDLFIG